MTSNTDATFCSFDAANAGGCAVSKECSGYDGNSVDACKIYRD